MGHSIYNLLISGYGLLLSLLSPFNKRAYHFIEGRRNIKIQVKKYLVEDNSEVVWVHAASLGEFEQVRPLIKLIGELKLKIVLTFFSNSGYDVHKNWPGASVVLLLPLDTPKNARNFVELINPKMAVFVKYDFWVNYMNELGKRKIPLIYVSCLFRANQLYFNLGKRFYQKAFRNVRKFFVQNEESMELLKKMNISSEVIGDTRFDQVSNTAIQEYLNDVIVRFKQNDKLIVAGSIWLEDLKILSSLKDTGIKLVIAPHEFTNGIFDAIKETFGEVIFLTKPDPVSNANVLIVDTIGDLKYLYRYAEAAFVGGTNNKGLHNILEPAAYGLPVFYEENVDRSKYPEAIELYEAGGGFLISEGSELVDKLLEWKNYPVNFQKAARSAKEYVMSNSGATSTIFEYVKSILK